MHAEDNDRLNSLDVEVLKVLFLIKWVKEMPKNMENIATLMVSHIDEDKIQLKKDIEGSLDRLVKETLIQKNGNEYIFLTHDEQDVNKEIQNISIDISEIILKVGEEIYTGIYSEKKFRYNARYHFDFNKVIDDRLMSTQRYDIGVKIITPYFDTGVELTDNELKMMSARENNLIIKLPSDPTFLEEMENILKIQTYLKRKAGAIQAEEIEEIKIRKSREVAERKDRFESLLKEALKEADFYVNMQKIDIKSKNPIERINSGLKELIDNIYNKLNYITDFIESTKELHDLLFDEDAQINIFGDEDIPNKLAIDEIIHYIDRNTGRHIPTTMKTLLELYDKPPYGWLPDDIRGIVIKLFKSQEIMIQLGSDYLNSSDKNLIQYTTKKDYVDRLLIKKRTKIPEKYLNNARMLVKEVFNCASVPGDEDGLMIRFKELSNYELSKIRELLVRYEEKSYPGKDVLDKGRKLFEDISQINDATGFFEKLYEAKEELLDYEEEVFDVKKFFKNQKEQFDKAVKQLGIYDKNKTYVIDRETIKLVKEMETIVKLANPYSHISRLPSLINDFVSRFTTLLEEECKPVRDVIESDWNKVNDELELYDFKDELSTGFNNKYRELLERLDTSHNFYEAIAMKEESDRLKMRCFEEIKKIALEKRKERDNEKQPEKSGEGKGVYITKKTINVSVANIFHGAKTIESENDIEELLEYLRKQLKDELKENTVLRLI